jgi:hypothetical protein
VKLILATGCADCPLKAEDDQGFLGCQAHEASGMKAFATKVFYAAPAVPLEKCPLREGSVVIQLKDRKEETP